MALTKVTRSGITDDSINADKIEDGTIVDADITPGTITNAKLAGSIANDKLANSSLTINGSSVSLGGSVSAGTIDWQSKVTSDGSTVTTMVAGRGYFVDNSSAVGLVKLPASASAGDTIAIKDYAANFGTNKLTIQRNSHKIQGNANDSDIKTNRASVVLVYVDATKGWLYTNESNVQELAQEEFIEATGGTILTSVNFKTHIFTGDGCFVVSQVGNLSPINKLDYLVVAGGGSAGGYYAAGGAGGLRYSNNYCLPAPLTTPLATTGLCATAATFPITVGGGGAANPSAPGIGGFDGNNGSNSVFSTITSAGGGKGVASGPTVVGGNGGSGGNSGYYRCACGQGQGNTPPVSPPQGNPAGRSSYANGGGGGGAGAAGGDGTINGSWNASPVPSSTNVGGAGGVGAFIDATYFGPTAPSYGTPGPVSNTRYFAGGGGAGVCQGQPGPSGAGGAGGGGAGAPNTGPFSSGQNGTANTGGGGGGSGGGTGGKGFVAIRYKFQ